MQIEYRMFKTVLINRNISILKFNSVILAVFSDLKKHGIAFNKQNNGYEYSNKIEKTAARSRVKYQEICNCQMFS